MKTLWTALFTVLCQLFLASGFIAIAQGMNSNISHCDGIKSTYFFRRNFMRQTEKSPMSSEKIMIQMYVLHLCLSRFDFDRSTESVFECSKGPKYVLLYGVVLSAIIGLIRQFSSIQTLGTSIIKLCATQEQQERCLGSISIDSNSIKQKTE